MSAETAVRERPIPFSGPMVRAILDGRKTQTRRVVKASHVEARGARAARKAWGDEQYLDIAMRDVPRYVVEWCPYGQPGDRLWVRETWYCDDWTAGDFASDLGERPAPTVDERIARWLELTYYRADGEPEFECDENPRFWKPSIHMPRWASRLTLEITEVRVQRLQAITDEDARAEGVQTERWSNMTYCPGHRCWHPTAAQVACEEGVPGLRGEYAAFWDSLNAARGYGWDANPWVWAITFRVLPNERATGARR